MRLFIADDDLAIRSMLRQVIEASELGQVVGEAKNGSDINIDLLINRQVDVLFIDCFMPIKTGIQTVREIKPRFNGKIIMLSSANNKNIIRDAYEAGVDYYINKPFNCWEITNLIHEMS